MGIEREAGYTNYLGYRQIRYKNKLYHCHKLALYINTGEYPDEVDHINQNPSDNRLANLRAVTHQQNMVNSKIRVDNKTGVKGVCKFRNKYIAYINRYGKRYNLGEFKTIEEAIQSRKEAERKFDEKQF